MTAINDVGLAIQRRRKGCAENKYNWLKYDLKYMSPNPLQH